MLFPLENTRVKLGTVLIEIVLSGDSLYTFYLLTIASFRIGVPSILFLKEIARIPLFNTFLIRKTHFLPPEIQIKDPFFPIVTLYENNSDAKYID